MDIFIPFVIIYVGIVFLFDRYLRASGWRGPVNDHFDGKRFWNIGETRVQQTPGFGRFLKWIVRRQPNKWKWRENQQFTRPVQRVMGEDLVVTFINHATVLIQTQGLNIITDPVFSYRVSPFPWLGPKRYRKPGVHIGELPPIDFVLLSHNHYDHMDIATLRQLQKRSPIRIIAGLGNGQYLKKNRLSLAHELDWWESEYVSDDAKITCVPAQHFSSRAISDRNKTLWCGYVLETAGGNIYFAGDTGYGKFVRQIHERFEKFRLALLPIGAFHPRFMMHHVHISPEEAVNIHHELHVRTSIGIHFGTFRLADDGQDEPQMRIEQILNKERVQKTNFLVLQNGESIKIA